MSTPFSSRAGRAIVGMPPVWVMAVALVAVGVNLRVAIASVPPLVHIIATDLHLSSAWIGALTTLPVLCMGLFAPVSQRLGRRVGSAMAVLVAVGCVFVGSALRLVGEHLWALYLGTFVAGVGIAIAGTLLPGLVKALFPPARAGAVTGLYMLAMMGGAAASSAVSVPLADALGSWEGSLASWSLLAVLGALAWVPVARGAHHRRRVTPVLDDTHDLPWRNPTAWVVAGYLAAQSWQFYSSMAWIAPSYVDRGWDASTAGYLLSVFSAAQLVSGLLGPVLSDRIHDHRALLLPAAAFGVLGLVGLVIAPKAAAWSWVVLLGLGQGAAFSLALVLLVDYATTPAASARLAGMAFFFSYTIASFGPTTMGAIRDATGGFHAVWVVLLTVMAAQIGFVLLMKPDLRKIS